MCCKVASCISFSLFCVDDLNALESQAETDDTESWIRVNEELVLDCEYIIPNLTPGTEHGVRVSAVNVSGVSEPTEAVGKVRNII